ncbi:MAG: hypothetical protein MAG453_00454 [Calditrichaeota bacterium]|nr:hypothetical protein [Calditrichota bacterium]
MMSITRQKLRTGAALLESRLRGLVPAVRGDDLFPTDLLIHFTYHKCLTVYSQQVMRFLSAEFPFHWEQINKRPGHLLSVVHERGGKRVLQVANVYQVDFHSFPEFRGSHFIRDPRDMVISAYYYHVWTREPWCIDPDFDWTPLIRNPHFRNYISADQRDDPGRISYQDYLKSLDRTRGMILEMLRNKDHIDHMSRWDYNNPNFIEVRYEDVVGAEVEAFRRVFEHYGFHPKLIERGLHHVDRFSLGRKRRGARSHTRSGRTRQHEREFTPELREVFAAMYGPTLSQLGYE